LLLLEHAMPDLILMDAVMPRIDGFETCRAIKQIDKFAHLPVIFMTGLSDTENVVKGFAAGGVDYITKPVIAEEMLARIRVHLANARLAQSARRALDTSGSPLIAARADGEIIWITPQGLRLLDAEKAGAGWREALAPQLSRIVGNKLDNIALSETSAGTIYASLIGEAQSGEYLLRLKDENAPDEDVILKKHFSLTDRESEVLVWIAKGKSNRDIGEILTCSPRTVNKHLEQIYQKLQVENRTAAAMRAIHVLMEA
jgi:DNA-binding NarL/FixJ family response regulator